MNCLDVEAMLHDQLDHCQADLSAAAEHLAECARCRELQQSARLLTTALQALPTVSPPAGLSQRLVAGIRVDRRRRLVRGYCLAAVAAAAAVMLLIPVLNWMLPPADVNSPIVPGEQAVVVPPAPKQPEQPAPAPTLKSSVDEARLAVVSLTERLADKTTKHAQQLLTAAANPELPPMAPAAGMSEFDASFDPARRSLEQVTANVGGGLQVVTSSAQQAVNYFSREIPTFKNKSKSP